MNPENDRFYLRAFYGLLLIHFLIWFSLGMVLDIHPDTADHWVWSQNLSWGYYEHPPMIAWVVRFFTLLLGNNQCALVTASQIITLFSFLPIFLLTRQMFGTKIAFWSALCLEATPLFTVGSILFVIDTVLVLFLPWTAFIFWKGFAQKEIKFFYGSGLILGLSLLSKVTAVLFPFSCLIFLMVSPEGRNWLKRPHLYLALLLALLIFSPFIYWNMNHDWISFKSQLEKGLILSNRDWNEVIAFWLGQLVILGPVLFLFFLKGLWSGIKKFNQDQRVAYLVLLTVIPFLVFGLAAFKGKSTDPSWADIGWLFGAVLAGKYFADRISQVSIKKSILMGGLIFTTSWLPVGLIALHSFHPFLPDRKSKRSDLGNEGVARVGRSGGERIPALFSKP